MSSRKTEVFFRELKGGVRSEGRSWDGRGDILEPGGYMAGVTHLTGATP